MLYVTVKLCKSTFLFKFTLQLKFAGCAAWNPLSPVNLRDSALVSKIIYICFLPPVAVLSDTNLKEMSNQFNTTVNNQI